MSYMSYVNEDQRSRVLSQIAEQAVPDTLDLWPTIQAKVAAAPWSVAPSVPDGATAGWYVGRRLMFGLAAGAASALGVGATLLWNRAEPVSAETILDLAQATANSPRGITTYHLRRTQQVPVKGNATVSGEIWFGGRDRQRFSQQVAVAGRATVATDNVFDGQQAWFATTENGQTRVVHTVGAEWTKPADDLPSETSLADVLTKYSTGKLCADARQQGEASVAGRPVYVIVVTPKPGGCVVDPNAKATEAAKITQATQVAKASQATPMPPEARAKLASGGSPGFGQMLVWVDKQSFLPLKTEVRDQSGALLERSEVTAVEYNVAIPDSTFTYTPPAGATVSEFTGRTADDVKRTLAEGQAQPAKKP